jgi:hypothetical protein
MNFEDIINFSDYNLSQGEYTNTYYKINKDNVNIIKDKKKEEIMNKALIKFLNREFKKFIDNTNKDDEDIDYNVIDKYIDGCFNTIG